MPALGTSNSATDVYRLPPREIVWSAPGSFTASATPSDADTVIWAAERWVAPPSVLGNSPELPVYS